MKYLNSVTDLQAADFALGGVFARCFAACSPNGAPKAFQRFLSRPDKEKIYYVKNDDVQAALRKIAALENDNGRQTPDLPLILYYREQGFAADSNQHIQIAEAAGFVSENAGTGQNAAMRITAIPLTLTYSMLFLAWDRASIERMALAWWAYIAPLARKHSRFMIPYTLDGESFEVGASVNAPREILTSSESVSDNGDMRLWGSRTMVEVNTQAVYGAKTELLDYFKAVGEWETMQNG